VRTRPVDRRAGLTNLRRYTWWTVPGTAAVILILFYTSWLLDHSVPIWARAACGAALAIAVVACIVLLSRRLTMTPDAAVRAPPRGWLIAGNTCAAVLGVITLAFGQYGRWALAPAMMAAITAAYLRARSRRWLIIAAAGIAPVLGGVVSLVSGDDELLYATLFPLGLLAFTIWTVLGPLWAWDVAGELDQARHASAELAVKDERLRFAADLHDIQGHHLQVIAVKSELAARLVQLDPARAAAEMVEVQRLSTDALRETRALVHGYRQTTLDDEISNATRILASADIDARMSIEPNTQPLSRSSRHLLGLVMREATTNVLRHSHAAHAQVDYRIDSDRAQLLVCNDGVVDSTELPTGSGLATLAERLLAAGGELTWQHDGDRFTVTATLPVDAGRVP
jgi:two-component system, NarL family, sensor histidine kinase DesK